MPDERAVVRGVAAARGEHEVFLSRQQASIFLVPTRVAGDPLMELLDYFLLMELEGYWSLRCHLETATRLSFKPAYCV